MQIYQLCNKNVILRVTKRFNLSFCYLYFYLRLLAITMKCVCFRVWHVWSSQIQGISEKYTEALKFGCRVIFWSIYLSKSCRKIGLISLSIYRIRKKKSYYVCIILNVPLYNDPCWRQVVVSYFEISSGTLFRIKL